MDYKIYKDFGKTIMFKLREDLNAYITFDAFPKEDIIIFNLKFKGFEYKYCLKNVQDCIYSNDSSSVVNDIENEYWIAVRSAFFKTEKRKQRDKNKKMGIPKEEMLV